MDWMKAYAKWMWILIVILNFQVANYFVQGNPAQQNLLKCPKTLTCHGKCTNIQSRDKGDAVSRQVHCHCDPSCTKYNDCCHDFQTACPNIAPSPKKRNFTCRRLNDEEPRYWMVEQCPSTYKDTNVTKKCHSNEEFRAETFFDQIPVNHPFFHVNYKNVWCAKCHGNEKFVFYFNLKIKCNVLPPKEFNTTQTLDYMIKHCNRLQFKASTERGRRFCFPTIDSCPVTASAEAKKACLNSPVGVVYSRAQSKNYRSLECMACHVNASVLRQAECGPQTGKDDIFNPSSFEVVMDFRSDTRKINDMKSSITCNKGSHVFDDKLEICRQAPVQPTQGVTDKFQIKMWLSPLDGHKPVNFSNKEFVEELAHRFVPLDADQVNEVSVSVEDRSTTVMFNLRAKYHDMKKLNKTNEALGLDRLFDFEQSFKMSLVNRQWLVFKVNTRRISCTHKEEYPPSAFTPLKSNDTNSKIVLAKIHGKVHRIPKNQLYVVLGKNGSNALSDVTHVICRSSFTVLCNHSMLALVGKEYTIFENKSLLFKPTGQWYNEGEYDTRGNTTWICTNYTFSEKKDDNSTKGKLKFEPDIHFKIRRYMTIVGFSISVLCLFLVLLTHGILRDLRAPLPGKNLISLSLSLFLAHFWYLLGSGDTDKPVFCRFTAYILHYLFLVTFGCTFIVAYDTRRTFSAKTGKAHAMSGYFQNKRLVVYLLISWGIPFIFVATCAILDGLDVVAIDYGTGLACWIGDQTALLIVFATPVGLVLVYNVVAFSQTVYAINSAKKHGQRVKSTHYTRPATVKIYMRLASLMGFSWFFAISAPLIHHGLMYPFVFFTTLQGLYIFLAFVFKTKVLRMIKAKLPLEKRRSPSRRPTKATITTMADSTPYNKYTQSSKDDTHI